MTDTPSNNDTENSDPATLIEFPAEISIKAMGLNANNFEQRVGDLVKPELGPEQAVRITSVSSSAGKYLSVRVHLTVQSHAQLLSLYKALRADAAVLFTL